MDMDMHHRRRARQGQSHGLTVGLFSTPGVCNARIFGGTTRGSPDPSGLMRTPSSQRCRATAAAPRRCRRAANRRCAHVSRRSLGAARVSSSSAHFLHLSCMPRRLSHPLLHPPVSCPLAAPSLWPCCRHRRCTVLPEPVGAPPVPPFWPSSRFRSFSADLFMHPTQLLAASPFRQPKSASFLIYFLAVARACPVAGEGRLLLRDRPLHHSS